MARRNTHRRSLTLLLLLLLVSALAAPGPAATQDARAPGDAGVVLAHVAVKTPDRRYIAGLRQEHFEVWEGKTKRPATLVGYDLPASVVFVVDVSGSMYRRDRKVREGFVEELKRGIALFAELRKTPTEFALVTFAVTPRLVADFTSDASAIAAAVDGIETEAGRTALYDGVVLGIEKASEGANPRKVVVVLSDGRENMSRTRTRQFQHLVQESNVMLMAVCYAPVFNEARVPLPRPWFDEEIAELADDTGGGHLVVGAHEEFRTGFEWAAKRLENQYTLRFARTPTKKSRFVKFAIRLSDEALRNPLLEKHQVDGRRGYRTPEPKRE